MRRIVQNINNRLSLGFSFRDDRELISLVYINYFLIFIFGIGVIVLHATYDPVQPAGYRYHAMIGFFLVELWLLRRRWITLARVLMLTILPFVLIIFPPPMGYLMDEFFFWFPYLPIGLSLIPHFILHTHRHRAALIITLGFYFLIILLVDDYLILFSNRNNTNAGIVKVVEETRFYYQLLPTFIFLFVNVTLGLLFARTYRYEEIMRRQQEELVQSEKMASLGTLTSGLAHEINNPLNFISGSLQALATLRKQYDCLETGQDKDKKKILQQRELMIQNALEGVNRAEEVVKKLLFFANPEVEKKTEVDLDSLVQKAVSTVESVLPYYIRLKIEIPGDLKVHCQARQIHLVFTHILRNAIDALESKLQKGRETIEVIASKEKINQVPYTRISFSNTGPPIPEKELSHIFDPFFSSKEAGEGVGLGMSLSYMIIREHGGRIEVKNEAEMVRFNLLLPFRDLPGPDAKTN
ncbi:MAG: ATP-binding protein [Bacteroidota bacterium]